MLYSIFIIYFNIILKSIDLFFSPFHFLIIITPISSWTFLPPVGPFPTFFSPIFYYLPYLNYVYNSVGNSHHCYHQYNTKAENSEGFNNQDSIARDWFIMAVMNYDLFNRHITWGVIDSPRTGGIWGSILLHMFPGDTDLICPQTNTWRANI